MVVGAVIAALLIFSLFLQVLAASPKSDLDASALASGKQDATK